jgi:DNA-binding transcriptional MerR regulator
MDDLLLETSTVGRRLELSAEYVRRLANQGVLPVALRTHAGRRLFRPEDVEALRLRREQHAREEQE